MSHILTFFFALLKYCRQKRNGIKFDNNGANSLKQYTLQYVNNI